MDKIWKVIDVINWGRDYFVTKGIDSPRLNIELILCSVLKIERVKLYTDFDLPLIKEELAELKSMIIRRSKREPLQYILGSTSFMGLEIDVNPDVLIPRPETEELVDLIIKKEGADSRLKILDIGTGSGCIAIALAKHLPNSHITGIDISDSAIKTAEINRIKNGIENILFEKKDFLTNCNFSTDYDVLVSNPPYISKIDFEGSDEKEIMFEPRFALTDEGDGLLFYKRFAEVFFDLLKPSGRFYLEIGYNQSVETKSIFAGKYNIEVRRDFAGIDRIIEGCVKNV
ncbi:MAG: peptide chain release factor N(5)-glutamine methyltransferase [Candidatus Kapabacteria bacterium]|nr:peptide chain release factor N(5)-glutamine methyltransferase [Candidatus Kapabacteria bacterium]